MISKSIWKNELCACMCACMCVCACVCVCVLGIICLMAETTIVKHNHIRAFYTEISTLSQVVVLSSQYHSAMTMTMAGLQTWASQYCWLYGLADLKPRSLKRHMCR